MSKRHSTTVFETKRHRHRIFKADRESELERRKGGGTAGEKKMSHTQKIGRAEVIEEGREADTDRDRGDLYSGP